MTISDITELLQQAGSCKTEAELLALFEEAGEEPEKEEDSIFGIPKFLKK